MTIIPQPRTLGDLFNWADAIYFYQREYKGTGPHVTAILDDTFPLAVKLLLISEFAVTAE